MKSVNEIYRHGWLDVQTTIGFGQIDFLKAEIERVIDMFADGGLIFCTTHFVQDQCSLEELVPRVKCRKIPKNLLTRPKFRAIL